MTRAASQAGDAKSCRTSGLNSSIKTCMNDHTVYAIVCATLRVHQLFRILY